MKESEQSHLIVDVEKEETKEPTMELEIYGIKCEEESCGHKFDPQHVKIYCQECDNVKIGSL